VDKHAISRREFGLAAGAAGVGFAVSGEGAAATEGNAVIVSQGLIETPPTYFDVLAPAGGSTKPPMVLISGGAHTGACYLATADGRPGWAHAFVRAGHTVVVPDWPGVGRSGHIPLDQTTGEVIVEGLGQVIASLGQPANVMTHSMSGAYGWKLVEKFGRHIDMVVAIAPGGPGNIQAVSDIISETADTVVVKSSVTLTINLRQSVVSDRNFVEVKLVGTSTQFPREFIGRYASSLVPIPPRLLYERRNIRDSQLKVGDFANYRGRRILVVTGTADADHPRKLDESIVEFFNKNGAKADYIYLGDRGIVGNGHMMMMEKNSDAIAQVIVDWLEKNVSR
jgi:pimeloyl-ACP methyl ester carboxylesterase